MKLAKNRSLWELAKEKKSSINLLPAGSRADREKIGQYNIESKIQIFEFPEIPEAGEAYMTEADKILLRNFVSKKHQTMGDILTVNDMDGSAIISSLEKLVNLGLIKRNWEKEEEMHTDIIYSLTQEGHYIAMQRLKAP